MRSACCGDRTENHKPNSSDRQTEGRQKCLRFEVKFVFVPIKVVEVGKARLQNNVKD